MIMKAWIKVAICMLLAFLCTFTAIGYAALSRTLMISGSIKTDIPYGLFIISVKEGSKTRVDESRVDFIQYSTTIDSMIDRSNSGAGSVTYTVRVLNNTSLTYSYRGIYYQTNLDGYNGNNYVATANSNSKIGVVCSLAKATADQKIVKPGEELEFTVTYTVGNRMNANTDWKTLINFQFGINVDGEREALEVVEKKFLDILNTTTTYNQLIDSLDNKFDGRQEWTSNYIGNVTGSSSEDSMAVNTLFAGQLQITVGKDQMDATVLIKHENLDGNLRTGDDYVATNSSNGGVFRGYGCEMTLYLTVDPLTSAGRYVPVYAVVFTCDRDENGNKTSEWYRIGSTYAGTANVVTYNGGNGTGSFVTDNWVADAESYDLIGGYSFDIDGEKFELAKYTHNVADGASIKNIVSVKDERATETLEKLFDDAKRIIEMRKYAGSGIEIIQEAYNRYYSFYTVDENGNHTVDPDLTLAQLSPVMVNMHKVINDALVKMDALAN